MSKEFSFTHTARSKADPEVLYELVADGSRWSSWAGPLVPRSSWVRTGGDGDPLGVGAVRKLGMWPVLVQERTGCTGTRSRRARRSRTTSRSFPSRRRKAAGRR